MSRLFFDVLEKIKHGRVKNKISQREAGLLIGCNQSQYGKKERGKQQFSLLEVCILLDAFSVDPNPFDLWVL